MLGLCCKEDHIFNISSLQLMDEYSILSNNNSLWLNAYLKNMRYKQQTCGFCYNKIIQKNCSLVNNMIIILSCKHIFHLNCFIKYSKWNYIKNINDKNINDRNINDRNINDRNINDKNKNDKNINDKHQYQRQHCIICQKETPNYLSIFTLYKNLLENIKKEQKTFIKNMII